MSEHEPTLREELGLPQRPPFVDEPPPRPATLAELRSYHAGELVPLQAAEVRRLIIRHQEWSDLSQQVLMERAKHWRDASPSNTGATEAGNDTQPRVRSRPSMRRFAIAALSLSLLAALIYWGVHTSQGIPIKDGLAVVTLEPSGEVAGLERYTAEQRGAIARLLRSGQFPTPAIFDEISQEIGERSAPNNDSEVLLQPVGTGVLSARPRFIWNPFPNATSYRIVVLNALAEQVATGTSTGSSWEPPAELTRDASYTWRVYVTTSDGRELVAPTPQQKAAKFKVLSPQIKRQVEREGEAVASSPLLLLQLYARFGLLDDAERELRNLCADNADSAIIEELEKGFQNLRKRAP